MQRLIFALLALPTAAGCQNQGASLSNPFLAADRVPPPSTRAVAPGTAQPYYPQPTANAAPAAFPTYGQPNGTTYAPNQSVAPPGTTPVPSLPPAGQPAAGGYNYQPYQGGAVSPTSNVPGNQLQTTAIASQTYSDQSFVQASYQPGDSVRIPSDNANLRFDLPVPPANISPSSFNSAAQPSGLHPNVAASQPRLRMPIETILDQRNGQTRQTPHANGSGPTRPAIRPLTDAEIRGSNAVSQASGWDPRFSNAADHSWLRGRVVASPDGQQRAVQFDMQPDPNDRLRGVAWIENPQVLAALQPGEFVAVRGNWRQSPGGASSAPRYHITRIQRQQL